MPDLDVDTGFFDAGGTSIGATRAAMTIARRWGVEVPLRAFLAAPTARGLASVVRGRAARAFDPVVPLRRGGDRPPLFLVHPIGGTVLCYRALAEHLPGDRPVHGLQAAGAEAGTDPLASIPDLAASYTEAIRRVHPDGPFHIGGWSFGGYVALEIARTAPDAVASVSLLDTVALRDGVRPVVGERELVGFFFRELLWSAVGGDDLTVTDLAGDDPDALFASGFRKAVDLGILPADGSQALLRRLYAVFRANYRAAVEWPMTTHRGPLLLLRAADELPPAVRRAPRHRQHVRRRRQRVAAAQRPPHRHPAGPGQPPVDDVRAARQRRRRRLGRRPGPRRRPHRGGGGPMSAIRRPLSPMERWYWVCDQLSPLNVIARVEVTGDLTTDALVAASAGLVAEHPLLRVAIADDPEPRFTAASADRLAVRAAGGRWEDVVDDELATPLDWRAGPLARVVHLDRGGVHDVVLTASHVIADGTTALALLRGLVELAAGREPRPRPVLPPPEALLPKRIGGLPRAAHLVATALADTVAGALARPRRLAPEEPVPARERRSRLIHREIGADHLADLVRRCRAAGVTVHSALAAAMATAVAEETGADTVTIGSPVDFRAELDPPVDPDDAGAYVATVPSHVRVAPGDLWATARRAQRDLRLRVRARQHLGLVSLLRFLSPRSAADSDRAVAMVDKVGPGNVCLSNLGRVAFPDRVGGWALSGAQFIAGISVSGTLVAAVNTTHGALHWNFTHVPGAVSRARAERIADRAVASALDRNGDTSMPNDRGAVLVTGASSGLGEATALGLARAGFTVYAGVRSTDGATKLEAAHPGIRPLVLDVTSPDAISAAGARLRADTGSRGLLALVNNAGICVSAPLECVALDDLRAEFEVHLVGTIALVQELLPLLRCRPAPGAGPAGRIVNVSSGIGRVAPPFLGAYAASQFAKEGLSDTLRRELAPLSVSVSVVEPGAVMTPIWGKIADAAGDVLAKAPAEVAELYRTRFAAFVTANARRAEASRTKPEDVAGAVLHAVTAARPRTRYRVGLDSWAATIAARVLPDRLVDATVRRQFPADR
ncbi:SDR family NAD(P)-dependent oxidoreductase [Actinokineospora soli]|uniref:Phthiocerol/phthiodiolone dimycocerosyl transferase n=1 Tax=Actinokineospora soli TaxID=1048753 RepID=A0ABW2TMU7_9PSEU